MKFNVRSVVVALAAGTLVMGAGACGGDDDGEPDAGTPQTDGGTATDAGTQSIREEGRAIAVSNGSLIVVGSTERNLATSGVDMMVRRYTASGELDTSFGTQGATVIDFEGPASPGALAGDANPGAPLHPRHQRPEAGHPRQPGVRDGRERLHAGHHPQRRHAHPAEEHGAVAVTSRHVVG